MNEPTTPNVSEKHRLAYECVVLESQINQLQARMQQLQQVRVEKLNHIAQLDAKEGQDAQLAKAVSDAKAASEASDPVRSVKPAPESTSDALATPGNGETAMHRRR